MDAATAQSTSNTNKRVEGPPAMGLSLQLITGVCTETKLLYAGPG